MIFEDAPILLAARELLGEKLCAVHHTSNSNSGVLNSAIELK